MWLWSFRRNCCTLFAKLKNLKRIQTRKIDKLNLLCKDNCQVMEKFIMETKKLNKDEEA